jgi:stage V sporulation protein D (sporulation-specific penicillin-binding protein)
MEIAERVGSEKFYKYVTAFGFRKRRYRFAGEDVGIFHQLANLNEVELATSSFGQTFKVTPIQMITAIAAVANGGKLLKPYVVSQYLDSDMTVTKSFSTVEKRQVISEKTSENLRNILESVVTEGTGSNAYTIGFRVAGKNRHNQKK